MFCGLYQNHNNGSLHVCLFTPCTYKTECLNDFYFVLLASGSYEGGTPKRKCEVSVVLLDS